MIKSDDRGDVDEDDEEDENDEVEDGVNVDERQLPGDCGDDDDGDDDDTLSACAATHCIAMPHPSECASTPLIYNTDVSNSGPLCKETDGEVVKIMVTVRALPKTESRASWLSVRPKSAARALIAACVYSSVDLGDGDPDDWS